jgi:hypothetical protein
MNHNEAQQSNAVARYILNEMRDDERGQFEEHYFSCRECGADVLAGERLAANGRALVREEAVLPFVARRSLTQWIPLASAAMLVVISTSMFIQSRSRPAPTMHPSLELASETFITGETRSEAEPPITLHANTSNNVLIVAMKAEWDFPRYEFELRKTDGKVDLVEQMTAEQAKDQVTLLPRSLPAGSYVLAIRGVRTEGNRTEIATHAVRVE